MAAPGANAMLMDDLFGSSDSDEGEGEDSGSAAAAAAAEAATDASARLAALGQPEPEPEPEPEPAAKPSAELEAALAAAVYDDGSVATTLFRQWPLVALVQLPSVGGGRGVVTTADVPAGTVLMREAPFLPPPPTGWFSGAGADKETSSTRDAGDVALHTAVARHLLATGLIRCPDMLELHPQTLTQRHLTEAQIATAWGDHGVTIDALLQHYTGTISYTREEVLRCVLQVQFNAFGSGVYLALAMINHHCSPNCSKFEPETQSSQPQRNGSEKPGDHSAGENCSEIVAVVAIPRGAEVTIHYANPLTRSHRARAELFLAQHHFKLGPTPFGVNIDGEIAPASVWLVAEGVERRLDRLEPTIPSNGRGVRWREALGLLDEASGCLSAALGVLPGGHLVVVRAHLAMVRAAQAVIGSKKAQYGFEEQQKRNGKHTRNHKRNLLQIAK